MGPENLHRVPGPEAILYSLHRDPTLKNAGLRLPHSQTPIGKIVRQAGCIALDSRQKPKPLEPRQPGEEVQFDLKDGSQVPADPEGKRQHVVEVANFIDAGTSIWLHREVRSACRCIGQARSRRSSPLTEAYLTHYNSERPNQARSCGNHPPRVACPTFPTLPAVPQTVDPDRWLVQINQQAFARTIRSDGKLTINHVDYYVSRSLAGQRVTCWVNAAEKRFDIWQPGGRIKSVPIKGLHGQVMPFEEYVALMKREARSEYRQYLRTHPRLTQGRLWA
ncbi:MAG TPA: hypothetical protein VEL69_06160 [Ktedonobacteraceae bacterium]|nr:hypothetical protein [Ktedonobacteraceae bacterium]